MIDREKVKQDNHALLRELGLRVNETLQLLEEESELRPKTASEVALRAVILGYVLRFAFGRPTAEVLQLMSKFDLDSKLTEEESELLASKSPSKQELIDATWQIEGVQCLAWCLQLVELDHLKPCEESLATCFPKPDSSPEDFIQQARLRPFEELYQQADLHYRMHWAARDARLNRYESPVHESIVSERRRAIDWVIGVAPDWYDMPMDT